MENFIQKWSEFNSFYKVSSISLIIFLVGMVVSAIASSRWEKLKDDYKVLLCDTLFKNFMEIIIVIFIYMLLLYPIYIILNYGNKIDDIIIARSVLVLPLVALILIERENIKGYKEHKHWIQLHELWEGDLDNMRDQLRDGFSSVLVKYGLSLECFKFYVPQEQNEKYQQDGHISYDRKSSIDALSIVDESLISSKYNVVIYRGGIEISVLSREDDFYKRILEDVYSLFEIENNSFKGTSPDKIRLSIVAKNTKGNLIVFRGY